MSHANAALTPRARLRLAQLFVDRRWPTPLPRRCSWSLRATAQKWADRYRAEGPAGMADRCSRPHTSPTKTSPDLVRQIVRCDGATASARPDRRPLGHAGLNVHAVLVRCRINRLSHIDRSPANRCAATSTPIRLADPRRRHQVRQHPRRRRVPVRRPAQRERTARPHPHRTPLTAHRARSAPHSSTPSSTTTPASPTPRSAPTNRRHRHRVLQRAVAWLAQHGHRQRVLSDTARLPITRLARACLTSTSPTTTRPYRHNQRKIERFHRTLADAGLRPLYDTTNNATQPSRCSTSTITTAPTPPSQQTPITH